jgi:hypothetical protein
MKKTILAIGVAVVLLAGCGSSNTDASDARFSLVSHQSEDGYGIRVIRDRETGCQYVFTTGSGTSVTPLLKADGTPLCD